MSRKSIPSWIPSYAIVALILLGSVLIAWFPLKSFFIMGFFLVTMALCVANGRYFTHGSVVTVRTLIGIVFIFSSLSKGVDPLGTTYQIQDYLEAYRMGWLSGLSVPGAFVLNLVEFCVGVFLILNIRFKYTVWVLTAMMVFFTGVTIYDAVGEPVPDCGCFGKALVITNWQTFYKNLALDAGTIILLFACNRVTTRRKPWAVNLLMAVTALVFLGFESYNYRYLPLVNFLEWKKGERLFPENPLPVQYHLTYRNKKTGETQEYLLRDVPFNDSVFKADWEFAETRTYDPNPTSVNINILDKTDAEDAGEDITKSLLESPDNYLFLVAAYNLDKANRKGVEKVAVFVNRMREAGYDVCFLTASEFDRTQAFKQEHGLEEVPFYFSDDKAIEAVIRSNPGVVLVRDAYVLDYWDWRRLPSADALKKILDTPWANSLQPV